MNVAFTQLQHNSWGFIRSFETVCGALGIELTLSVFFTFYEAKGVESGALEISS